MHIYVSVDNTECALCVDIYTVDGSRADWWNPGLFPVLSSKCACLVA